MEYTLYATCRLVIAYLITVWCGFGVRGLHELDISVPAAVLLGESVVLECTWRLEDEEALYSVKWYRGRDEFYRYIPKELPHTRVFPQPGIEVDISRSGARRVVLQHATPEMAGRFRCEVSADAPTFHTEIRSAHLDVVEPPPWPSQLMSDRSWYGAGSVLRASCAVPPAYPPANITWMLNGIEMDGGPLTHALPGWFEWEPTARPATGAPTPASAPRDELEFAAFGDDAGADADGDAPLQYLDAEYVERHRDLIRRRPKQSIVRPFERTGPDNRRVSFSEVSFAVMPSSFERGVLRLTCVATIYNLHAARAELAFDMEQPEVASVLGVRNRAVGLWRCAATSLVTAINSLLVATYR